MKQEQHQCLLLSNPELCMMEYLRKNMQCLLRNYSSFTAVWSRTPLFWDTIQCQRVISFWHLTLSFIITNKVNNGKQISPSCCPSYERVFYSLCIRLVSLGGGQGLAPIWERGVLPCTMPGEGACAGRWTGAATSPWAVCTIWYAIWLLEGGTACGCVDISRAPPPAPPWWCEGGTLPAEDTTCQTCYGTS